MRAEDSDRDLTHVTVGGWGRFGSGAVVAMADLGFGDDEERDKVAIKRGLIRKEYVVIMKLMNNANPKLIRASPTSTLIFISKLLSSSYLMIMILFFKILISNNNLKFNLKSIFFPHIIILNQNIFIINNTTLIKLKLKKNH